MPTRPFLAAKWEYLAMLNYVVDPAVLAPHIPPGTTLDLWQGKALVSVVGFMFNHTRVMGVKWPLHTHFEEVNLRYYVKREGAGEVTRGVGFISKIVPRPAIARIANMLYNEHYRAMPMRHTWDIGPQEINVKYEWRDMRHWEHLAVTALNDLQDIPEGSEAEFILEHYWGYNALSTRATVAYGVEHPRWQVYPVIGHTLHADIARLYGASFAPYIQGVAPHSVFLARGSDVVVRQPQRLLF